MITPPPIKMIFLGHSGMGKTGALASLASAGYRLRVIDLDAGANILRNVLTDPKSAYLKANPQAMDNVSIATVTEDLDLDGFTPSKKKATVWTRVQALTKGWKDDEGRDYGPVREWGRGEILVIDSLTRLADAAIDFFLGINGRIGLSLTDPRSKPQAVEWGIVSDILASFIEAATLRAVPCNVIFNAHIEYISDEKTGILQGFPAALGKKLLPKIPRYFNNMLLAEVKGPKRIITTDMSGGIALKNENPYAVVKEYPLETGLADYFKALRGPLTNP